MAKKAKTYESIDRPYDSFLRREKGMSYQLGEEEQATNSGNTGMSGQSGGGGGDGGSVEQKQVKSGQSIDDLWISSFIRSENWQPKVQGFYIDGRTGYAEFSNVFISGSLVLTTSSSISGGQTDYNTGAGFFLGYSGGAYKFSIGVGGTGPYLTWDGSNLLSSGASITAASITSPGAGTDISLLDYTHDITFSSTDVDTVAWTSGTLRFSNGQTKAISAGNTGNMGGSGYVYFDNTTPTILNFTVLPSDASGATKVVIAKAAPGASGSGEAVFQVFGGAGGLKIGSSALNIANNNWTYSGTFTAIDADTIEWSNGGILKVSNGTQYTIANGTTFNMTAKTYIYFDIATPTAFKYTQSAQTAVGDGKILIAVAENVTTGNKASFFVMNEKQASIAGSQLIDGTLPNTKIVAGSISATEIAAGAITAGKIAAGGVVVGNLAAGSVVANSIAAGQISGSHLSVTNLGALKADLGTITAGTISLNTSGYIRSGQTAYNTGTGWWLGIDSVPKFSIGSSNGANMTWNGTTLSATDIKIRYSFTAAEAITIGQCVSVIPSTGVGGTTPTFGLLQGTSQVTITSYLSPTPDQWAAAPFRVTRKINYLNRYVAYAQPSRNPTCGQAGYIQLCGWDPGNKIPTTTFGWMLYCDSCTSGFTQDSLSQSGNYLYQFSDELIPGVDYCIRYIADGTNSSNNADLQILTNSQSSPSSTYGTYYTSPIQRGTYASGVFTWTGQETGQYPAIEFYEKVYGELAGGCCKSSSAIALDPRFKGYVGIAQNSAAAGEKVGVAVFGIAEDVSGLSIGSTYYMDNSTQGGLRTTVPTGTYVGVKLIGNAISTSNLLLA